MRKDQELEEKEDEIRDLGAQVRALEQQQPGIDEKLLKLKLASAEVSLSVWTPWRLRLRLRCLWARILDVREHGRDGLLLRIFVFGGYEPRHFADARTHARTHTPFHAHTRVCVCVKRCVWVCACVHVCVYVRDFISLICHVCVHSASAASHGKNSVRANCALWLRVCVLSLWKMIEPVLIEPWAWRTILQSYQEAY